MGEFDNNGIDNSGQQYIEPQNDSSVLAIISLVCGIISLVCCCSSWLSMVAGVAAVVLGIVSINKQESAKGIAIAGIICGGAGLVMAVALMITRSVIDLMDFNWLDDVERKVEYL